MSSFPFTPSFTDLPGVIPLFPLAGAVLLPKCQLPLNIFEPRYLEMVQDAMRSHQLIGMIQPRDKKVPANLYPIGCAGRIVQYEETMDGRIQILLHGICRYRISEEVSNTRSYLTAQVAWTEFESDYSTADLEYGSKSNLLKALKAYFGSKQIDAEWSSIERLNTQELVNNIFGYLPLSTIDKQAIIESNDGSARYQALLAIITGALDVDLSLKH